MRRTGLTRSTARKNRSKRRAHAVRIAHAAVPTPPKPIRQPSDFYGDVNMWWTSEQ